MQQMHSRGAARVIRLDRSRDHFANLILPGCLLRAAQSRFVSLTSAAMLRQHLSCDELNGAAVDVS